MANAAPLWRVGVLAIAAPLWRVGGLAKAAPLWRVGGMAKAGGMVKAAPLWRVLVKAGPPNSALLSKTVPWRIVPRTIVPPAERGQLMRTGLQMTLTLHPAELVL